MKEFCISKSRLIFERVFFSLIALIIILGLKRCFANSTVFGVIAVLSVIGSLFMVIVSVMTRGKVKVGVSEDEITLHIAQPLKLLTDERIQEVSYEWQQLEKIYLSTISGGQITVSVKGQPAEAFRTYAVGGIDEKVFSEIKQCAEGKVEVKVDQRLKGRIDK